MKTRWKILIAIGIFLVLSGGVSFLTMRMQPESQVESYKNMVRAKGEKLEPGEVLPPLVPPESDSVNAVQDAIRMFGSGSDKIPDAMERVAPGKAMVGRLQPDVRGFWHWFGFHKFLGRACRWDCSQPPGD